MTLAYSAGALAIDSISFEWILLSSVTLMLVSRIDLGIPKVSSGLAISDTFIFISVFLFGPYASVVLAGADAAIWSLQDKKRRPLIWYNTAVMSLAVFVSSGVIGSVFSDIKAVSSDLPELGMAAGLLALIHFALNSGLISAQDAIKSGRSFFAVWKESFLWTTLSYVASALSACIIVKLITVISFYAFIISIPILAITYFTYKVYLDKVETSNRHAEQMADLHLRTIEALAIAIDAKDEVTHDHVHRVQLYATEMAKLFGLSEPEIEALKAGALLHDIGKLAVPDYILNKPGPLTPAEFDRMKVHTIVGAEILERVGFPYPVVPVVRHHHERWDGRGYPDGLKGEQIPMTARILMVVDCFDAVREDRQYRKAMTREQAIELLKSGSATMYDPEVVRVFLERLPQFEEEIKRQRKERQEIRAARPGPAAMRTEKEESRPVVFEHIRNAHREVITLYDIAQTIGTSLDLRDMFAVFSSRLQDIVSYTTCALYLQKQDTIELEAVHVSGRNAERLKGKGLILGSGITGWVAANRQPMYNSDPRLDFDAMKLDFNDNYRTVMCVPLMKDDEVLGALTLYSSELKSYEPDHLRLLEAVAKLASDAIANACTMNKQR
jgi:putative nucleotidyltransferase with HDIG domain